MLLACRYAFVAYMRATMRGAAPSARLPLLVLGTVVGIALEVRRSDSQLWPLRGTDVARATRSQHPRPSSC